MTESFRVSQSSYEKNHRLSILEHHRLSAGNSDFVRLANDFLAERLEFISSKTVQGYKSALEHYSFLEIKDFDRPNFQELLKHKANSDWTRRTLLHKILVVSIFGNWLCDNHHTSRHHRPKQIRKPVQRDMPEFHEVELLFDALRQNYQQSLPRRRLTNLQRYLITRIIYETGCRISECLGLYLEDVRIKNSEYFILIRGTKTESAERTVKITSQLFDELNDYRNTYELTGRLFSSKRGNTVNPEEFSKWLRLFCEKLGISCKIHPHLFRYLFIVQWIRQGKDLGELMHRLGHSDVSMTIYYAKQVARLCHDIDISESISMLERQKSLNARIYNNKPKGW